MQANSEYGWPETLISDNGPCYVAEAFTNMMTEYGVNHITSFPHYPQSNGLAEKCVQIVKNLFNKEKEEGKDMFKCLMIYHNTPLSSSLQTPMQILQSRSARSVLPLWQGNNLVWTLSSLEANTRMNIYLHMIYTWI